jgi:hypothetical protein
VIALVWRDRPPRLRWLVIGLAVGGACWLAPILQGLGSNSNISALATSTRGLPRLGFGWGLRVLGTAGSPSPLWLHHLQDTYFGVLGTIAVNSPAIGAVVLGILVVIATWAWRTGRVMLGALALVTLVSSVATAIGFALVPVRNSLNLAYMITVLWAVSVLIWSVVLWALVLVGVAAARRMAGQHSLRSRAGRSAIWAPAVLAVPVVVLVLGIVALSSYEPGLVNVGTSASDSRVLPRMAAAIERVAPQHHFVVRVDEVGGIGLMSFWLSEGAAWSLEGDGWHPGLEGMARAYTGLAAPPGSPVYRITVDPGARSGSIRVERSP